MGRGVACPKEILLTTQAWVLAFHCVATSWGYSLHRRDEDSEQPPKRSVGPEEKDHRGSKGLALGKPLCHFNVNPSDSLLFLSLLQSLEEKLPGEPQEQKLGAVPWLQSRASPDLVSSAGGQASDGD